MNTHLESGIKTLELYLESQKRVRTMLNANLSAAASRAERLASETLAQMCDNTITAVSAALTDLKIAKVLAEKE